MTALPRLGHLIGAVVVGAALTLSGAAIAASSADAVPMKKGGSKAKVTKEIAQAKVEIKTETGAVLKSHLNLDWGKDGNVELAAGETKHAVGLKVERDGEAQEITVTLTYDVDGSPVIEPYVFDMNVGKREVIRVEDGAAIALTVTPKKVKTDEAPPPPPEEAPDQSGKIEVGPDTDDPLGGLE